MASPPPVPAPAVRDAFNPFFLYPFKVFLQWFCLLQRLDAFFGLTHPLVAFELEGLGHHTHGEDAQTLFPILQGSVFPDLRKDAARRVFEMADWNGVAIFDMSGFTPWIGINLSLPGLYRNERLQLPEQGQVVVTFRFEQPPLPTSIP